MTDKTRNSEALASFVAYCEAHPEQRFWQALRNWSGHAFILTVDMVNTRDMFGGFVFPYGTKATDTFYREGGNGQDGASSQR